VGWPTASSAWLTMGDAQKRARFFEDVRNQKLNGIRYVFGRHFVNLSSTTDEEGLTALQIAASLNKSKSLSVLVDHLSRSERKALDVSDDDGMTPLMMAAAKGHAECVKILLAGGANRSLKSDEGLTALEYATNNKHANCISLLDGSAEKSESESDEPEDAEAQAKIAARIREMKLAKKAAAATTPGQQQAAAAAESKHVKSTAPAVSVPTAKWVEVANALKEGKPQLSINRENDAADEYTGVADCGVDPAIWFCPLNTLVLRLPPGVLTSLPVGVARLHASLTSLTLAHNSLVVLPEELGALTKLKILLLEENQLTSLPDSIGKLSALEVLNVSGNKLTSLSQLAPLTNLVSVTADRNMLTALELPYSNCTRLSTLSACRNAITEIPAGIGQLQQLTALNLADNQITMLPREMGELREKKLLSLSLDNNPIADSRVVKILQKGRAPIKELLMHLRKEKKGRH